MLRLVGLRLLLLVPVLFLVSMATFSITELLPGDPALAILGESAHPELIRQVRAEYGFDRPIVTRYLDWAGDALRGDLGRSLRSRQPVTEAFAERLPVTLQLAVMAQLMALALAVPLAAWSAWRAGSLIDRGTTSASFAVASLPTFLVGILLVWVLAVRWSVFPVTGFERLSNGLVANLHHAFLPALSLALVEVAVFFQVLRAEMAATLREGYITAARSRGLPTRHILVHEAMRPSSFTLLTLAGINLGQLIGGAVIVEYIFGLGGLGTLITQSVFARDFPVLQGSVLMLAVAYLLINTVIDLTYYGLDPRIRRPRR